MPLTVTMLDSQSVTYAVEPENAEGVDVPDTLTWTADPAELVALTPATDGKSCSIKGNGAPGTCVVTVGDGHISDTVTITLQDLTAASLGLHLVIGPIG